MSPKADSPAAGRPLVLNVDDRPSSLYLRHRLLTEHGFTVADAVSGAEALRLSRELRPDLILLDIHLPDADGRELCQRLKGDPHAAKIPIVLISASLTSHAHQLEGVRWAGADGFIGEPFNAEALISTIRAVLRAHPG